MIAFALIFLLFVGMVSTRNNRAGKQADAVSKQQSSQKGGGFGSSVSSGQSAALKKDDAGAAKRSSAKGLGNAQALLMPGIARISQDAIGNVLKQSDNIPLNAAALLWTKDEALWDKAREQMHTQPVLASAIAFSGRSNEERLEGADALMKADPGNPLGYVAALDVYTRMGDAAKVEEILSAMPSAEKMNSYGSDMRSGARELLDMTGYNPVERGLLLANDRWESKVVETLSGLTSLCSADLPSDVRAQRASVILDMIDAYRNSASGLLPYDVSTQLSRTEELTLRRIPGDFLLGDGTTAGQYASQLSTRRVEEIEKHQRVSAALESLDQEAIGEYYGILDAQGEKKATKWLIGE